MQTTSYSLGILLRRVREKGLTIPQFQRKLVWKPSQVKLLIDSISRSYPIGSLLILEKKPNFPLNSRSIDAEIQDDFLPGHLLQQDADYETKPDGEAYILDGQQRITSIARVFLNSHPEKIYYFDLKKIFEVHSSDDETSWICVHKRLPTNPDRKRNNKLLRADLILDQQKADIYVSEYIEDSGDFPEFESDKNAGRQAAAKIKGIFETIRNYKVPIVLLEPDRGIESICRVFETINSTGTKLGTFDLAVARYFPKPDLRQFWDDSLQDNDMLSEFEVGGERVLQVLALTVASREKKYPSATRSDLLALNPEVIFREWPRAVEALNRTYKWASELGARKETLPNHNVLTALAAVLSVQSGDDLSHDVWPDQDFIRRWYFSKVLQAGASQASNYRISENFSTLQNYVSTGNKPLVEDVKLNPETILKLRPTDGRYKSLQCIFSNTIRHDLISGHSITQSSILHDHHIYPKNSHRSHGISKNKLDCICNRIYVLANSNLQLGEGYPRDYFKQLSEKSREAGTLEGLQRRLSDCMIPGNPAEDSWADYFSIDNFDTFCRDRAELIISRVREVVGDSLKDNLPTSEEEILDDD